MRLTIARMARIYGTAGPDFPTRSKEYLFMQNTQLAARKPRTENDAGRRSHRRHARQGARGNGQLCCRDRGARPGAHRRGRDARSPGRSTSPRTRARLAELAVEDTGLGNVETRSSRTSARPSARCATCCARSRSASSRRIPEKGIVKYAKPVGVVGAITPSTNPSRDARSTRR